MLYAISVSLSIVFGGTETATTFDINPTFIIEAPVKQAFSYFGNADFNAVTFPHLILVDPSVREFSPQHYEALIYEESLHAQQWSALGPWFLAGYVGTFGRAFEPYDPVAVWLGEPVSHDFRNMWIPTPQQAARCPLIRISSERSFQLLPCWFP